MAEYNSSLIEEFSDIWVFCEQRDGKLMPTDYELISEGRKLADQRGSKLVGLLLLKKQQVSLADMVQTKSSSAKILHLPYTQMKHIPMWCVTS